MEVLQDLAARRDSLDKKEQELQTREALLRAAEQEIDRKYQELSSLRSELENLLNKQSEEEKSRIISLVKVYENMKPKEAARIFDTLDIPVLMSVMSKMSERKLSPIMASMNPERAKTMTIMLAEEKALPTLPPADR
jgi:flagellar motility protein MotE (MotC chaperone)